MKTSSRLAVFGISVLSLVSSASAHATWKLVCVSEAQENGDRVAISGEVFRQPDFTTAKMDATVERVSGGVLETSQASLSGSIIDGRSLLKINLKASSPEDAITELNLDLSYDFSSSRVTLKDGTSHDLQCGSATE